LKIGYWKKRAWLGAHASLRVGREAFKKTRPEFKLPSSQTVLRREARRSTQGCVRSQQTTLFFSISDFEFQTILLSVHYTILK
jgi:hypothetical protein